MLASVQGCYVGETALISGCFPLDPFYKELEEAQILKKIKAGQSDTDR